MSRLTNQQLDLASNARGVLAADLGRPDSDLARILGVGMSELRSVIGWLYGTRRVDRCASYLVLPPRPAEGRRAA